MRYFIDEKQNILTIDDIKKTYQELKQDGCLEDYDDFNYFLNACMDYNNGELTEVTENDVRKVTVITWDCFTYTDYIFNLKTLVNAKRIQWDTVKEICLNEYDEIIL